MRALCAAQSVCGGHVLIRALVVEIGCAIYIQSPRQILIPVDHHFVVNSLLMSSLFDQVLFNTSQLLYHPFITQEMVHAR